jgi:hypothetical protein
MFKVPQKVPFAKPNENIVHVMSLQKAIDQWGKTTYEKRLDWVEE